MSKGKLTAKKFNKHTSTVYGLKILSQKKSKYASRKTISEDFISRNLNLIKDTRFYEKAKSYINEEWNRIKSDKNRRLQAFGTTKAIRRKNPTEQDMEKLLAYYLRGQVRKYETEGDFRKGLIDFISDTYDFRSAKEQGPINLLNGLKDSGLPVVDYNGNEVDMNAYDYVCFLLNVNSLNPDNITIINSGLAKYISGEKRQQVILIETKNGNGMSTYFKISRE